MPALPPDQPASTNAAGDGAKLTVDQARGGQRSGIIWILVIGLALVVVAMVVIFLVRPAKPVSADDRAQASPADASNFQAPQPSPKQAPPDMPSTTGQTTPDASSNAAH